MFSVCMIFACLCTLCVLCGVPLRIYGFALLLALSGCRPVPIVFEPEISYEPQVKLVKSLPSPFLRLTKEELRTEWGKEFYVGLQFGREMDLYRAITAFKRSLLFMPLGSSDRKTQANYYIMECYYLGMRYDDALNTFYETDLLELPSSFPASRDLAIMLYDCYQSLEQPDKAAQILVMVRGMDPCLAERLEAGQAIMQADFGTLEESVLPCTQSFLEDYSSQAKSPAKARLYNALLPGAGYAYVGQTQTALTSFCLNAVFIGATYTAFRTNNIPLAVILASFEGGWYFGGIHGAGLAAKKYNEVLYAQKGKDLMLQEKLFPVLMLEKSF